MNTKLLTAIFLLPWASLSATTLSFEGVKLEGRMVFAEGQFAPISQERDQGISFTVDGKINSFSVLGFGNVPAFGFETLLGGTGAPEQWTTQRLNTGDPSIFSFSRPQAFLGNSISFELTSYGGNAFDFFKDLRGPELPALEVNYGFRILELDYTPNNVPEEGSGSLLLLGVALLGVIFYATNERYGRDK
jgi:hypothetical protein